MGLAAMSQMSNPVKFSFSAKKINSITYEVCISAKLEEGWHIYSQFTPSGGPIPTVVGFTKNPLVSFDGDVKEVGKLEVDFEKMFGVEVKQFDSKVDFIQIIRLKKPIKTNVAGFIKYMVCDNEKCLPPATKNFTIAIK